MFPIGHGESVADYVAPVIEHIAQSGFKFHLTPMGTIIETDTLSEAFGIVESAYEKANKDDKRIYICMKLDIRPGKKERMDSKITSIENRLGYKVNEPSSK